LSIEITDQELATRLREVLKHVGLSQRDVSLRLGVPYRSVQTYLAAETRLPATFVFSLCQYLGIEADYLLTSDFRLNRWALYDAVTKGLDDAKLLPMRGEKDKERVETAMSITMVVQQQYDLLRRADTFKKKPKL
jgi:transcriptional regulator with XRE-family HTH domain